MKLRVLIVPICAFLVGCRFEMPEFDSGKLEHHLIIDGSDRVTISALSQEQLSALTKWFSAHQPGWENSYDDAAPVKIVHLSRGGVAVAYFNLSGNLLYAAHYVRILTSGEQQALEAILNMKKV